MCRGAGQGGPGVSEEQGAPAASVVSQRRASSTPPPSSPASQPSSPPCPEVTLEAWVSQGPQALSVSPPLTAGLWLQMPGPGNAMCARGVQATEAQSGEKKTEIM